MIDYLENSDTKLKFVTYPLARFIVYTIPTIILIFTLYWSTYYSPIESSLTCHKTASSQIDCILKEKSILNPFLTRIEIQDLKKVNKFTIGGGRITLEPNYSSSFFNLLKNPEIYHFPSKRKTILEFSNFDLRNPFKIYKQASAIDKFIADRTNSKSLNVKQNFTLLTFSLFVLPLVLFPSFVLIKIIKWLLVTSLKTVFDFNKNSNSLIIYEAKLFRNQVNITYPFADIQTVELEEDTLDINDTRANVVIKFKNDREYLVDEYLNKESARQYCQSIHKFIQQHQDT